MGTLGAILPKKGKNQKQKKFPKSNLLHRQGKSTYRGKVTIPLVQSSTKYRIGCWCIGKYVLSLANKPSYSWFTTAHVLPSPSACIEIFLYRLFNHLYKSRLFGTFYKSLICPMWYKYKIPWLHRGKKLQICYEICCSRFLIVSKTIASSHLS